MTHEERVVALQQRGFTLREAGFLALVLLHSGHFLRRQCTEYLGVADGSRTTDLIHKLLQRNLATRTVFHRRTCVYHVFCPAVYAAIDQEQSRHIRPVEPAVRTQRLMTLDVIIAHRTTACLATPAEKIDYFGNLRHVPAGDLPAKICASQRPDVAGQTRYFVDHVPVLLGTRPTFVYVPGWTVLEAFNAFLRAYTPLLRSIHSAGILFCTADDALADRARRLCARRFRSETETAASAAHRMLVLAHFRARARFEARDFRSFTTDGLEELRKDLEHYRGPWYEAWYQRWREQGDQAIPGPGGPDRASHEPLDLEFNVFRLTHQYPLLGKIRRAA